ncbi:MAG: sigma-54 dependent transcriptional regulator [Candidatus Zixiibacteriota bacterium]|jgi:DNA-binding NtrC family response regulator
MKASVLIVEDEAVLRRSLAKFMTKAGYDVLEAEDGETGVRICEERAVDAVLLDLKLPGMDGLAVLREIKLREPTTVVIMMTAFGDIRPAVEAIKYGAYDYVKKPFEPDDMLRLVENALHAYFMRRELSLLQNGQSERFKYIVSESPGMRRTLALVDRLSATPQTQVLIVGETGTGKEVIAREIHRRSARARRQFVAVNCSALSENLLESELFGHTKGAFTDARKEKRGLFEYADGGTLFLDEIGDMQLSLQPKLLRAVEEKTIRRVGGLDDITVDVRILAATNRDLRSMVDEALFREDLYYRLNVFTVYVPPLRERPEDILPLATYFVEIFNAEFKKSVSEISPEAEEILLGYRWPGNVRELRGVIERAVILTEGDVLLPSAITIGPPRSNGSGETTGAAPAAYAGLSLDELERRHILDVMAIAKGNRSRAAKMLQISRTTLWAKLKRYGALEEAVESPAAGR